jgi:hypothetical protein
VVEKRAGKGVLAWEAIFFFGLVETTGAEGELKSIRMQTTIEYYEADGSMDGGGLYLFSQVQGSL